MKGERNVNKKRNTIIIVIVITAAVFTGIMILRSREPGAEAVKTAAVTQGEIKSYLSTNATIKSKNVKAYFGASQFIVKSINAKVGDTVKKGEVLLSYDLSDLKTSLQQARIQYSNALLQKEDLINQKKELDNTIKSLDKRIEQLENYQNPSDAVQLQTLRQQRNSLQSVSDEKLKIMDNAAALAKLGLDTASSRYDKYRDGIVADTDGVVTAVNALDGSMLSPAQPAFIIQQLDNLKAVLSLGKYDSAKVKIGQKAVLKNGDKTYTGTISYIDPAAVTTSSLSGQSTTLKSDIDILNPDSNLKVDFDVNVDILLGSADNAVKIPIECIKYDKGGRTSVFKVVDKIAKQIDVKLGIQSDTEAQVIDGLSAGDIVILNPGISISNGTRVK